MPPQTTQLQQNQPQRQKFNPPQAYFHSLLILYIAFSTGISSLAAAATDFEFAE
jgi:hypothetical protein